MFISFIVLNHNGGEVIDQCLTSLLGQDFPKDRYETIVVDNSSSDDSAELIQTRFSWAKLVRSGVNLGYAGGANLGARFAKGDVLVFLNNDVRLSKDWLKNMAKVLQKDGSAIVGSKIFLEDRPDRLNHAGGLISYLGTGFDIGLGTRDQISSKIVPVGYVSGAALMVPRQLFVELGGFDESYFLYCEDVDLCWRAWLRGYKVVVQPAATTFHKFQSSGSPSSYWLRFFHWHKNALMNLFKNFGVGLLLRGLMLHVILQSGRVLSGIRWGSPWRVLIVLRADAWVARNFRSIIARRASIQASRKLADKRLIEMGLFLPHAGSVNLGRDMFFRP